MPDGYTPVRFDIVYDCGDTSLFGQNDYISLAVQGEDIADQYTLAARRRESDNVADIGIHINNLTAGAGLITVTGDSGMTLADSAGVLHMRAYPINLVGGALQPGPFRTSATLTATVR